MWCSEVVIDFSVSLILTSEQGLHPKRLYFLKRRFGVLVLKNLQLVPIAAKT
jgi:hypothetical protein